VRKLSYKSDVYKLLDNGVEHHFELEFNVDGKTGFIDFIYFDKDVVEQLGYKVVSARLLWLN